MDTISFMTSLLLFYLKGEIKQEQNFVKIKIPNTILSVIPLGTRNETLPINQISTVETNFFLNFKSFIVGLILAFLGIMSFGTSFMIGLIFLVIGGLMTVSAFSTHLLITTTSGAIKTLSFVIFEKQKSEIAKNQILNLISNRMDDTNTRQQTDRIIEQNANNTDKIVNALK